MSIFNFGCGHAKYDETINVFEAVRRATCPYGSEDENMAALPPTPKEVLTRLGKLGYAVVPREIVSYTFEITESEQRVLDGNR